MAGNNPTLYGYVADSNSWIDPLGLTIIKRIFENAPYHGRFDNPLKSKAPIDGQAALNASIAIRETTPRRIGIAASEFVVLDQTRIITPLKPGGVQVEIFHGHVRNWNELTPDMKSALRKAGLVDKKGRIIEGCGK